MLDLDETLQTANWNMSCSFCRSLTPGTSCPGLSFKDPEAGWFRYWVHPRHFAVSFLQLAAINGIEVIIYTAASGDYAAEVVKILYDLAREGLSAKDAEQCRPYRIFTHKETDGGYKFLRPEWFGENHREDWSNVLIVDDLNTHYLRHPDQRARLVLVSPQPGRTPPGTAVDTELVRVWIRAMEEEWPMERDWVIPHEHASAIQMYKERVLLPVIV